jgi:hypothetical protein
MVEEGEEGAGVSTTVGAAACSLALARAASCCWRFWMYGSGMAGTTVLGTAGRGRFCWRAFAELLAGAMVKVKVTTASFERRH